MEMSQYIEMFLDESHEHLQAISDHLLKLEGDPNDLTVIGEIFRSAHTLKGMAATMEYHDIANLTHKMENVLDRMRNKQIQVTSQLLDILLESVESLEKMVESIGEGGDGKKDVEQLIKQLDKFEKSEQATSEVNKQKRIGITNTKIQPKHINEHEVELIKQAKEEGVTPYSIDIHLQEECSMKSVRAYMVFELLERNGDIIKSSPSAEQIEEEDFGLSFSVIFLSRTEEATLREGIAKISEIDSFTISEIKDLKAKEITRNTNSNIDFKDINEYEANVITQATEEGFTPYLIDIHLQEECSMKSVRAYMVFELLERNGDVIKSAPLAEQIEEEDFDLSFSVILLSRTKKELLKESILNISEVGSVTISEVEGFEATKDVSASPLGGDNKDKSLGSEKDTKESSQPSKKKSSKSIRVNIERIDHLMNLFEELIIDRGRLEQISKELKHNELTETVEHLSRISSDLQNRMLTIRMVPVEQVFNRFPRMVRGIAKDLNKEINLEILGAETELDRTVIDEIGDPLVHLLRNSLDHGIETPTERKRLGKNEQGKITLSAYHSGNHVFIEIEDDGSGINREKVINKALSKNIITQEEAVTLSEDAAASLIFSSGFSTAEKVSDLSGRGVGLDVVKNKIESLGGIVFIESKEGEGSKFTIKLPLTLSILTTMLVSVGVEIFAIPLSSIMETAIIKREEIKSIQNHKVFHFRNKVVPLVFLSELLEVYDSEQDQTEFSLVIVKKGDKMTGLVVDGFIGQREIVLKSLGNYLGNVYAISGATILGNGEVALILDVNTLIN